MAFYFDGTSNIVIGGNLGIGTSLPLSKLYVYGDMALGITGKINGVSITALNKRTRASSATASDAVGTWTTRTSAADINWRAVTWAAELSLFCAVADSGTGIRVMTSPDGITWTTRTSAADNNWYSVAWASEIGLFCAVATSGTGNRVMTSTDGITWITRTSTVDNDWWDVAWAPEISIFCAVASTGTGNRVMTSTNGITWVTRTSAADNSWRSVVWAPDLGLLCAVASTGTGNQVMTSSNGITWTTRTNATDNSWQSVAWAPELGLFCATAITGTGNRVMTSPDGITWVTRTSATDNDWWSVVWAPELSIFCATADTGTGNRVMTSLDGITWVTRPSAADNNWRNITWAPEFGMFCAVANSGTGTRVMTSKLVLPTPKSTLIIKSSEMTVNATTGNVGIGTTTPGQTLAVYGSFGAGDGTNQNIVNQQPGTSWVTRTSAADSGWVSVVWSPDLSLYCAVGTNSVMNSTDGLTWVTRTAAANNAWTSVTWGNSIFCAVAATGTGNRVMTSSDGITWVTRTTNNSTWRSVTYGDEFVAVGASAAMNSQDGITWTTRAARTGDWMSVCRSSRFNYVAVNSSGAFMSSPTGNTWSSAGAVSGMTPSSIIYAPEISMLCVVASSGEVATSIDGSTWTQQIAPSKTWKSITWSGDKFCAVASSGTGNRVMTSIDGITWMTRTSAVDNDWSSVEWAPALNQFCAVGSSGTGNRVMTSTYTYATVPNTLAFTNGNLGIGITNPSYQLHLSYDSVAKPSTTTWKVSSDRRLKTDIVDADLDRCYEVIQNLPLRRFAWDSNIQPYVSDQRMLGWIAQEVEPYVPSAITRHEMYGLKDALGLNSDQILKFMYGALQKTLQKIRDISAECDILRSKVEQLEMR